MKFFHMPNSCSLGIHVLLEEIGKPYELMKVDFASGAQYKEPYIALNPKSKVPALLLDDGTLVTELPAIAWCLAKTNPEAKLLPNNIAGEVRVLELLDYMIATVHMRGFTRIFRPAQFTPTSADEPAVQQTGKDIVGAGMRLLAKTLGEKAYLLGDYSITDAALFFLEHWAVTRAGLSVPAPIMAHLERMRARPAVQRALAEEGLS